MSRKAVLIEAGRAENQPVLRGAPVDVERMQEWLASNIGGAWEPHEIKPLHNPSLSEVRTAMDWANDADYSFVTFSGHGSMLRENGVLKQQITLGTGLSVNLSEIIPQTRKKAVVCDACRIVHEIYQMSQKSASARLVENRATRFQRLQYRQRFDDAIERATPGSRRLAGAAVELSISNLWTTKIELWSSVDDEESACVDNSAGRKTAFRQPESRHHQNDVRKSD